jgi:D-alanyl-D-alanine carboxypeptidase
VEAGFPGITAEVVLADGTRLSAASGGLKATGRMLAGSTGKTFVAAVILKAVDEGKLDLDSKIERWIGKMPGFDRLPNAHDLTLRLLMSHRSGIPDYVLDKEFATVISHDLDKNWSAQELVGFLFDKKPLFPADSDFAYADANFVIAGLVYETVTRRKLFGEVERRIVKPLKLSHTVPSERRDITDLVSGRLNPKTPFGMDGMTIQNGRLILNAQSEYVGGGMISNAGDLARWAKTLWEGKEFSKRLLAEALDAKPTGTGRGGGKDAKYGLAVQVQPSEFGITYGHAGWFPGYQTEMIYFPDHKAAIAVQVNADPGLGFKKSPRACLMEVARVVFQQ